LEDFNLMQILGVQGTLKKGQKANSIQVGNRFNYHFALRVCLYLFL
jgi:hypothetical protein